MPDQLLTLSEVAEHLGVPLQTIYTWRHHGEMPIGIRVGRHIRVRRPDLDAWLDAHADPPPATPPVSPVLGDQEGERQSEFRSVHNVLKDPGRRP